MERAAAGNACKSSVKMLIFKSACLLNDDIINYPVFLLLPLTSHTVIHIFFKQLTINYLDLSLFPVRKRSTKG
jgi:hypothetical protein